MAQQGFQNCGYGPSTFNATYKPAVVEERGAYHFQPQSSGGYRPFSSVQQQACQQPQFTFQQQACPPQQGQTFLPPSAPSFPYGPAPAFPVNWSVNSQPFPFPQVGASQVRPAQDRYWNAYADGEAGGEAGEGEGGNKFNPRTIYESMIDLPINIATGIRQRKIDMYHWAVSDIFAAIDFIRERQEMLLEGIKGIFLGPVIEGEEGTKPGTFSDSHNAGNNAPWAWQASYPTAAYACPPGASGATATPAFRYPTFANVPQAAVPSAACNPVQQQASARSRRESNVSAHTPILKVRSDSSCGPATAEVQLTTDDGCEC